MLIITALVAVPGYVIYNKTASVIVEEQGISAMNQSIAVAALLAEDIDSYRILMDAEAAPAGTPEAAYYERMCDVFREIKAKTGAFYLYTEKILSHQEYIYILDGEDPSSPNFSPIGTKEDMEDHDYDLYLTGEPYATEIRFYPEWGHLLTGYAPILDPNTDEILGLVGTDVSADDIQALINNIRNVILLSLVLLLLAIGVLLYRVLGSFLLSLETDFLTGLFNKRYFEIRKRNLCAERQNSAASCSVIMLDIDNFKQLNDTHGHPVGDQALKRIADVIKASTRAQDICSRFGGDEFIVMLPGAGVTTAELVAERIRSDVERILLLNDDALPVTMTVSVGIATGCGGGATADDLIYRADKALYRSKDEGKNRVSIG
jgi:diguanylate cyclase (GGDEF)-like protein